MIRRYFLLLLLLCFCLTSLTSPSASAQGKPPGGSTNGGGTASGFSVWIYPIYNRHCKGDSDIYVAWTLRTFGLVGSALYQWSVDGVVVGTSNSPRISRSWSTVGSHTVSVVVTIGVESGTGSLAVPIVDCFTCPTTPKAFIHATPISVCPNKPIDFVGRGEGFCFGNTGLNYDWNFGDGLTGTGAALSHSYAFSGQYTTTLTVSDGLGHSAMASKMVNIKMNCNPPPTPSDPRRLQPGNPTGMTVPVQCQGKAVASINPDTGNVSIVNHDPVPTRGFPLTCNVFLNSQVTEPNRAMGNAAFTYDIHLQFNQTLYTPTCASYTATVLVDEDGSRYPFTVAGMTYTPAAGVFSSLEAISGGYRVKANAPGGIDAAGGFVYEFDSSGRLTKITDPTGNIQTPHYDGAGNLDWVTDTGTGKQIRFEWSGGRIVRIKHNGDAQWVELGYTNGRQTSQATRSGNNATILTRVDYGYNPDGTLQWMQRNNDFGTLVTFTYAPFPDCNGTMVPVCTGATGGSSVNVVIDTSQDTEDRTHLTVGVKNAQNATVWYTFDVNGDVTRVREPQAQGATRDTVTEYAYDDERNLRSVTLDDGREYGSTYNVVGLPSGWTTPITGQTWTALYGGSSPLNVTGGSAPGYPNLGTVTYGRAVPPNATALPFTPTKYTDPNGKDWLASYNDFGQVTSTTLPGEAGAPSIVTFANYYEPTDFPTYPAYQGWAKSAWDSLGTLATVNNYDALGDVTSVSTSAQGVTHTTTFTYDAAQRLTKATRPDGLFTTLLYSGDNLTEVRGVDYDLVAGKGFVTFEYCAHCGLMNKITGPTLAGQGTWKLELTRNSDHAVTAFTDALNHATNYQYGQAGELKSVTLPGEAGTSLFYDNVGRLTQVSNAGSLSVTYDNADRVTSLAASKNSVTQSVAYFYNLDDSLAYLTDPTGRTDVSYYTAADVVTKDGSVKDVFTTLNGLTDANGNALIQKVSYQYYANGSRKSLTWTQGNAGIAGAFPVFVAAWSYTYDTRGRLATVAATLPNGAGTVTETTTYSYDNEDKLTSIVNANGTQTTFSYTAAQNWVSQISHNKTGGFNATFDLAYDGGANSVGNLTGVVEKTGVNVLSTSTYGYDALYRLTAENRIGNGAVSNSYGYDLAGNRTTQNTLSSTFDASNKILTLPNTQSVAYDSEGNQTRWQIDQYAQSAWQYTYDAWGHLQQNAWQGADIPESPKN